MGRSKYVNKAGKSCSRNIAGEECIDITNDSKINFLKNYMTFKKTTGKDLIDTTTHEFNEFYKNVNGYYKSRMKQLRREYESDVIIKNVKQEKQWYVLMNTLQNAHKEHSDRKVTHVLYFMSQAS